VSLRSRLISALLVLGVVILAAGLVIAHTARSSLIQQTDSQLLAAFNPAGGVIHNPADPTGPPPIPPQARTDGSALSDIYVGRIDAGGTITTFVEALVAPNAEPVISADRLSAASSGLRPTPFTTSAIGSSSGFRVVLGRQPGVGSETYVVGISLTRVDATYRRILTTTVIVDAVALSALGLIALWVIRLGVRPINELTAAATVIAAGDLDHRVTETDRRTEAARLAKAFNVMTDARQTSESRLRRFVADASHELRTPLTSIRGYADLYRSGRMREPADVDDAMRRISQESERMGGLVEDLLLLARLDEGRPLGFESVDLSAIAHDAVSDATAAFPLRAVVTGIESAVTVTGDEARLRQVISNVLTNALAHTPETAAVSISVRRDDGKGLVVVSDTGPGMDETTRTHVFDRFFRAEDARSRGRTGPGGSGLGLAIVDSIVRAHGGTVELTSSVEQGTTVSVRLPLEPQA
jgi:two-component system OmpR family sensor kinase